jgi:hypothetical protein
VRSVQQYLVSVAVLLVLLICTAAALVIYQVDRFGRAQAEQQLLATTRALSLVVDGEHKRYQAILDVLSTAPASSVKTGTSSIAGRAGSFPARRPGLSSPTGQDASW